MKKNQALLITLLSFFSLCALLVTDKISRTLIWVGQTNTGAFSEFPEPMAQGTQFFALFLFALFAFSLFRYFRAK